LAQQLQLADVLGQPGAERHLKLGRTGGQQKADGPGEQQRQHGDHNRAKQGDRQPTRALTGNQPLQ
nr:hypothetical protein [Tanacetum cinerariifolium]